MIPASCCAAAVPSGAKAVLLGLWTYAGRWFPGDGSRFVWPSVETLAAKLGRKVRGVYASLTRLVREGWIARAWDERGRRGWDLHPVPVVPVVDDEPVQLGFAWDDEAPAVDAVHSGGQPVEREVRVCTPLRRPCTALQSSSSTGSNHEQSSPHDDDASRIWSAYEAKRIAEIGGRPHRGCNPPEAMQVLAAELGGGADGWLAVERYGNRAIELAAKAKAAGYERWPWLVTLRADGFEWSKKRYDATMNYQGPSVDGVKPSAPPPPDPIVDGIPIDRFEREAWDSGGADAVRASRGAKLSAESVTASVAELFARMRGTAPIVIESEPVRHIEVVERAPESEPELSPRVLSVEQSSVVDPLGALVGVLYESKRSAQSTPRARSLGA
jgi:hypothetical protein